MIRSSYPPAKPAGPHEPAVPRQTPTPSRIARTGKPANRNDIRRDPTTEQDEPIPDVLVQFAHELSTPLSTVILNLEMVHDSHEVEPADERAW